MKKLTQWIYYSLLQSFQILIVIQQLLEGSIIGNDQRWGAEVEIQIKDYGEDRAKYCMLDNETNYASVACGLGCKGFKVSSIKELKKIIKAAFSLKATTIIDVNIEGLPGPTL